MGEIDYQMALLLQHKFEQEQLLQSRETVSLDSELAKSLQDAFEQENQVESTSKYLAYKINKSKDSTKSLTDPSWEVIDPTPDIHMLFIAFNERFFWNKLLAVCVSWSKRMTTCAGICSYQGRGGMCSITLSEPLLKLRPRKDLVETLLHEMIHAYLFVTHNNRDRDGHGPEFHKHMYRINEEAGTHITVYHSFHDEVRLYQQHWWRCDGPCQNWKPYYGTVRRAMNRAPGPSDRWWWEHSRSCGGTFIKIKEPEKPEKKKSQKSKSEPKVSTSGMKKYFPTAEGKSSSSSSSSIPADKSQGFMTNKNTRKISNSNIKTLQSNDNTISQIGNVISSKVNNIIGFTNLGSNSAGISLSSKSLKGSCKVNNSTIVITKRTGGSSSKSSEISTSSVVRGENAITSNGNQLVSVPSSRSGDDYAIVRNHWINKFESTAAAKRKNSDSSEQSTKVRKTTTQEVENVHCPVCSKTVTISQLNSHLDDCLLHESSKECIICGLKIVMSDYEKHVTSCTFQQQISDDDVFEIADNDEIQCINCGKKIENNLYTEHLKICKKVCVVCDTEVEATDYDIHVEQCLHKKFDEMEDCYRKNDVFVSCLACNKKICKTELNSHLEDCMSLSHIFDSDELCADGTESKENNYNCPFCMTLICESDMNNHLNSCLNIKGNTSNSEQNKTVLLDSFSSEESF